MSKSEKIVLIVAAVLIVAVIIGVIISKNSGKYVYYTTTGSKSATELIEDYSTFTKRVSDLGIKSGLVNAIDFSKSEITNTFNEEYFAQKKVAIINTYEDTSNSYMYSVDKVEYSSDKTTAKIYYTDKKGEYAGTFKNSWYNVMLVELDGKVTSVDFIKNAE